MRLALKELLRKKLCVDPSGSELLHSRKNALHAGSVTTADELLRLSHQLPSFHPPCMASGAIFKFTR